MLKLAVCLCLQDWELMVAQLEHQLRSNKLTLQALWYYVQPPLSGVVRAQLRTAHVCSAGGAGGQAVVSLGMPAARYAGKCTTSHAEAHGALLPATPCSTQTGGQPGSGRVSPPPAWRGPA